MADLISREALVDKSEILYQHTASGKIIPWSAVRVCAINNTPVVNAVEVVRCKDCVYWRDRHVLTPDGQRKSYAEMPPEAFSETGIAIGGVTCEYGINCGSRCELDLDSGYGVDKSVFREAGDFCSRGVKKDAVD